MSQPAGYVSAKILNHGTVGPFGRTEAVFIKVGGVLEVVMAGPGGDTINFGTVVAGTIIPIAIKNTTSNTAADIILLR